MATFDWTDAAASWHAYRDHVETIKAGLTRELLAGLRLSQGDRVLELGAGTGELALRLADAVGSAGHVAATDIAPGMADLIRRTADGHPEITASVVDATDTGLPSASYDAVVFRMGLMLIKNPERALAECRRVLRDRGRLGLAVWDAPQHNPWLIAVGMSAMMHGVVAGDPPTAPGGVFSLGDADLLTKLVHNAGFHDVSVRPVATPNRFATADEHFDTVAALAGPLRAALAAAPPDTLAAVRATAAEQIAAYKTSDGYDIPGQALLCIASA
ncbi:MAG: class I SAM-dependent methyltransferase [Micromonosporaceae bacterium]